MKAEIFRTDSNYKLDLQIILFDDQSLLTTIPKNNDFAVLFPAETEVIISIFDDEFFYLFNSNFQKLRKINDNYFFLFKINHLTKIPNKRKETRTNLYLPAMFSYVKETAINFATILDVSKTGMRIETNRALQEDEITLSFDQQKTRYQSKAQVVWSKTEGDKFIYGLQIA